MLPARKPKKKNRTDRWKSIKHRDFVRDHACANCGTMAGVEFAHVRMGSDAGMGRKPSDFYGVSLCGACHRGDQHINGEPGFWEAYERKVGQSVTQLMDDFNAKSPMHREIRQNKLERGL